MDKKLEEVLKLAALGFRMHPLKPGEKKPIVKGWPLKATTDETIITQWHRVDPDRNWGIALGDGFIGVDIDVKEGDGKKSWSTFVKGRRVPKTVEAVTPSKGVHLIFSYNKAITLGNSAGSIAPHVDIRADGGFIACQPSVLDGDRPYTWVHGKSPFDIEVAPAPQWLIKAILDATPTQEFTDVGAPMENGTRNNSIYHHALALARSGSTYEFTLLVIQKWLEASGVEDMTDDEIIRTVESAYKKAGAKVSEWHLTDMGNAERLEHRFGDSLKYSAPWGRWLMWNEKYWVDDHLGVVYEYVKETVRGIYDEAKAANDRTEAGRIAGHAFKSESTSKLNAMLAQAQTIPSMVIDPIELDSHPNLLNLSNGTYDLESRKLIGHNRDHLLTRMIDLPYDEHATCEAFQQWLTDMMSKDEDGKQLPESDVQAMVDYLQMLAGRMLFGGNPEKEAAFVYGPTNTGKSTLTHVLERIAGPYGARFNIELILSQRMSRNANDATPELAKLAGARIAFGTEMPFNRSLNEAIFKDLAGGQDVIVARGLHEKPFQFRPQFTLWMYGNDRPRIRPEDQASFGRLRMIPMKTTVDSKRIDPHLVDKVFVPEFPGILTWLIRGADRALHEHGNRIPVPTIVVRELDKYKTDVDFVRQFLDEHVVQTSARHDVPLKTLFQCFSSWCQIEQGLKYAPVNSIAFGRRVPTLLEARTKKSNGIVRIIGYSLTDYAMEHYSIDI